MMGSEVEEDRDRPPAASNFKVGLFIAVCVLILGSIAIWWFISFSDETVQPYVNKNTSTVSQQEISKNFSVGRTFDFKEALSPKDPEKTTPPPDEPQEQFENKPPVPPGSALTIKTVTVQPLDKSASSLSADTQAGSGSGLGLVPSNQTQTTNGFNLFSGNETSTKNGGLSGMLATSSTGRAVAVVLYNRDYLLAKGAYLDCVLNTSINSTVPGMTKCTLTRNVYSDNGNTLLLEKGSTVTGEYRANLAQGQNRLFVLWDRVKTPYGVVVDLASPATDSLGGGGVSGHVDTHFWQRFGGAMMLSMIDDFAAYAATNGGQNTTNFENSSDAAQNMAAEALKNSINIPPTFYKNQGERVGILIARDIDFSKVYQLAEKIYNERP